MLRILLILSAIDLLSSALTAGLVLFVILVGGDAGNVEASAAAGTGNGLNEVVAVDSEGEVKLVDQASSNEAPVPGPPDPNEKVFFNTSSPVQHRFYLMPSRNARISLNAQKPFELIVRPVIGQTLYLFFRCAEAGSHLEFSIAPLSLPDCQVRSPATSIEFPYVSTLLVSSEIKSFGFPEERSSSELVQAYEVTGKLVIPEHLAVWGFKE
jgi:hypothetical protein